jgi:two-component system chemotaxis response regulator CheB
MPIRVLIVDDSALMRDMLSNLLSKDPEIQVAGTARDPYEARELIRQLNPDVVTLDVEMPNMNGIAFLERLMKLRPIPVIMVSTMTQKGADVTLLALELGAIDFIAKPHEHGDAAWERAGNELRSKVRAAAGTKIGLRVSARPAAAPSSEARVSYHSRALVAIGASTGGVEALREVLQKLPRETPPVVVTQHMPAGFTARFAHRLDETCAMRVSEAQDGQILNVGDIVIAPGNRHLSIVQRGVQYACKVDDGETVSGHRPSVDVLFRSVAAVAGRYAVGVILTGMGKDGAQGLLTMRQAGARTIGQNEATSLVYGMPRVAKELGGVERELPLDQIATRLLADLAGEGVRAA